MATVAIQAPTRAAYDPVWTPQQFNFPVAQKFTGSRRPAPLDLSATMRPRRSRSSPAVSHFSVEQLKKTENEAPTGIITEQIIEEPPTSPLPPQKSSKIGEIVVGLGIPATLKTSDSRLDLTDTPNSARSTATTMSNQSEATSILTMSSVSSVTSASSTRSRRNADLATVAAMEAILDVAKLSPHYIPNIRGGVPSPSIGHPLPSPSNVSVRSAKSNASTVGKGPLSGKSATTIVGLPSSPKPKKGALSPNPGSTAPASPCLSFSSNGTRQTDLRSPSTTIDSSLPSPAPSTSSSLAPSFTSDQQPSPALSNRTGAISARTPPPPPYTRSPKLTQSHSQKSSLSHTSGSQLHKTMYAHSNASNASSSTHHSAEWEAVEALLHQVRLQQKQLEELQRSYEHRAPPTEVITPSRNSGSVTDGDSGVMNFEFGFEARDPLEQQRQEMNCFSPKQMRARALTTSGAGPESPIAYIPVPGSPMSPLHVPPVHQVLSTTPSVWNEKEGHGIGASFEKFWKGGRRLASRSRTPKGVRSSSMTAQGHQRNLSYEIVR